MERFKLAARLEDRPRPGEVKFGYGPATQGFKGAMTMTMLAQFLSGRLRIRGSTGRRRRLLWQTATIFTAIRDSLGLKLEPRNEPVQMLLIDHVQRVPTEN